MDPSTWKPAQKAKIELFACDMHEPFKAAIRAHPALAQVPIVHDPFHIMKRAGEAITELRRQIFFRGTAELSEVGRGTRWLVPRPWERLNDDGRARLRRMFALNGKLARAYQTIEQLREALRAPNEIALADALWPVLRRLARRSNVPMRKLRDSLVAHRDGIIALARFRPPTGRIEALNGNWETMVRRGRGYRDHAYFSASFASSLLTPSVTVLASSASSRLVSLSPTVKRHDSNPESATRRPPGNETGALLMRY